MNLKNTADRWGGVSQFLHWTIAVLILTIGAVGLVMGELPRTPKYFWVYTAHKSLGLTVLALVLARIGWRLYAGAPKPVPGTPRWQAWMASATHGAIYLLILAMPLSGWLYDSASGLRPFRWFGLAEVPKLAAPDEALASTAHSTHEWLFWLLIALVLAHAGAALHHHFVQRDATLARMLPRRWISPPRNEDSA
ncbi:cytochrome b [Pseudoxanthomonas broegbernensis]|uniref:Cytochrome b n=1 Tax=Pseudoxanthomonas broegbernensis TaxID=83619 RepID=A0A7V8K649_9GAMM|nr:cytochrome b [Pseudoxanthomonas broegbernensis]KAF1684484.1 cytochrome b [Pseudoxanthomonas broegbernensis]MBB6064170.1 cytochrome b561 [Pseudoxanthomonas broegbernensis]